ncbi:MAG: hypothetical protein LC639_01165 [Idiomarina sp.]|nr:hypothetical protein [Idiomarina sp.]
MNALPEVQGVRVRYNQPISESFSNDNFSIFSEDSTSYDVLELMSKLIDGELDKVTSDDFDMQIYDYEDEYVALNMEIVIGGRVLVCACSIPSASIKDDEADPQKISKILREGLNLGISKLVDKKD